MQWMYKHPLNDALAEEGGKKTSQHVLVFVSNRAFKNMDANTSFAMELEHAELSNTVVVLRDNCIDYFGPSLARRFMGYVEPAIDL